MYRSVPCSPNSRPANHTLVFRAFLDPRHRLVFTTDVRTAQATYLESAPWIEASWCFVLSHERVRIASRAIICGQDGKTEKTRGGLAGVLRDVRRFAPGFYVAHSNMNLLEWPETCRRRDSRCGLLSRKMSNIGAPSRAHSKERATNWPQWRVNSDGRQSISGNTLRPA